MKTDLYLIRHGLTVWNQERRLQGHQDVELHEDGIRQAEDLARYFRVQKKSFDHMYSSDLKRALKTADIISSDLGLSITTSADFRERDMGEWAGKSIEEIQKKHPDWMDIRNIGGQYGLEKTERLMKRMMTGLESIIKEHMGKSIAVVSHGGAINAVLTHLSCGDHGIGKTHLENTSVSHFSFCNGEWSIHSIGETPHMVGNREPWAWE